MERVTQRIRPVDAVVAGILCVLAAVMAIENIKSNGTSITVDSHSWLQVPLFVAAALPVLWWGAVS